MSEDREKPDDQQPDEEHVVVDGGTGEVHRVSEADAQKMIEEADVVDKDDEWDEDGEGKPEDDEITDLQRLEKLAANAVDEPLFASERDAPRVIIPGERGWFIPRPLNAEEIREYDELRGQAMFYVRPGASSDDEQRAETKARLAASYTFLVDRGIEEYELVRTNNEVEHGQYHRTKGKRQTEKVFLGLAPVISEWLELFLLHYNGMTDDQREARGN